MAIRPYSIETDDKYITDMIDTHCHLDDPLYADDFDTFVRTQKEGGVERIIVPAVNSRSIESIQQVVSRYPDYLLPAIGLHPEDVKNNYEDELKQIKQELFHTPSFHQPYIAIGEIGLDYYQDTTYIAEQKQGFRTQLQWANQLHLPTIIHNREATADILSILDELYPKKTYSRPNGVFHCFTGSKETAEELIARGFLLGIGGVITFKNCKLSETLRNIDPQHLVLETDSPYLTPVPYRGKRNESRWMSYVVDKLAEVYQCTQNTIIMTTTNNAKRLFGIK